MTPRARRARSDEGAVAIFIALCMTLLLVVAAMVIDFGLVRIDRQVDKSAADAATVAGLHALNGGDGKARPYAGVCAAIRYLQRNDARFGGVTDTSGTWTNGAGAGVNNGCTDVALRSKVCTPGSVASWAKFVWSGRWAGSPLTVTIQSGYPVGSTSGWVEDDLPAAVADSEDDAQGCNQLAVVVSQTRTPGMGSLATDADLEVGVRSVGRVELGPGGYAPAMLLLKRTGCPVLETGSNSGVSFIHVLGAISSDGATQPGTIHSDSDALGGCTGSSNQSVYLGKGASGIVAYAAPLASNPLLPDTTKPGQITSVAGSDGKPINFVRDLAANVYSSSARGPATAVAVPPGEPSGRALVTRSPVDARYRQAARDAMQQASNVFASGSAGYLTFGGSVDPCKPTQADVNALNLTLTSKLFVNCTTNAGFVGPGANLTINAGTVLFNGKVAPGAALSLPNAHHVYVAGSSSSGLVLGGAGASFRMNTTANTELLSGRCSSTRNTQKAVLFVKDGVIDQSNGTTLQLCKTTVFLMGGQTDGCVPATDGAAPTSTPCSGGTTGTGRINQSGGDIDWTAPDQYDLMSLPNGDPDPAKAPAWRSLDGPEDLALWSESGSNSSSNFRMGGGGAFAVRGVFMVPNAQPFTIGGNSSMTLANAQFIATSIALNGTNTNITMSVDPNSAVPLPKLKIVGLVR